MRCRLPYANESARFNPRLVNEIKLRGTLSGFNNLIWVNDNKNQHDYNKIQRYGRPNAKFAIRESCD